MPGAVIEKLPVPLAVGLPIPVVVMMTLLPFNTPLIALIVEPIPAVAVNAKGMIVAGLPATRVKTAPLRGWAMLTVGGGTVWPAETEKVLVAEVVPEEVVPVTASV